MKPISPIYRFKYLIVISGLFLYSCGGGGSELDDTIYPTYNELEVISYEMEVEIGEREGYIPGSISSLILTDDGSIIVGDGGNIQLDQYDSVGNFVRTIATEGNGPGEVPSGFSITDFGMGIYIVRAGGIRYYLTRQDDGSFTFGESFMTQPWPGNRARYLFFARNENEFYGRTFTPGENVPEGSDYSIWHVAILSQFGEILEDSLGVMELPLAIPFNIQGQNISIPIAYNPPDVLKNPWTNDGSYMITRPQEYALDLYNDNHELTSKIVIKTSQREFDDDELDLAVERSIPQIYYDFFDLPQSVENGVADYLQEIGKPGFLDVWASGNGYYLLQTDFGDTENEMVVIDLEGTPLGRFNLSTMDTIHYFRDSKIYTVHEDPVRGYFVRVYALDI